MGQVSENVVGCQFLCDYEVFESTFNTYIHGCNKYTLILTLWKYL